MSISSERRNVVILAAGLGQRFVVEGFTVSKPLIEFRGTSFLAYTVHVAHALVRGMGRVIVVGTPAVARAAQYLQHVDASVTIEHTQPGPAASGLQAAALLSPDERVVFVDCDNIYSNLDWVMSLPDSEFLTVSRELPNGSLENEFCNVLVKTERGASCVTRISEKVSLTGAVYGTGVYGFRNFREFQRAAWRELHDAKREVPMSQVLSAVGGVITPVFVKGWLPVGTPAQLAAAYSQV